MTKDSDQESLEERRLRLQQRREQLLAKKAADEAALKQEEQKRDSGDVFRRTFMKYNETEDEKKARLLRSLNALKACNTGVPTQFVGVKVGDPLDIEYY